MTQDSTLIQGITRGVQSTFMIVAGMTIWVDPFQVQGSDHPKADLLFITHAHGDHASAADMAKVTKSDTIVIGPADSIVGAGADAAHSRIVGPGESLTVEGLSFETVPAYNLSGQFHPRENNWVGYIFDLGGRRLYHAGDTDRIPEMKDMRADIVCLPIGGTYTMDAEQAAAAVLEDLKPRLAIPMHYGAVVGSDADGQRFLELCAGINVQILQPSL